MAKVEAKKTTLPKKSQRKAKYKDFENPYREGSNQFFACELLFQGKPRSVVEKDLPKVLKLAGKKTKNVSSLLTTVLTDLQGRHGISYEMQEDGSYLLTKGKTPEKRPAAGRPPKTKAKVKGKKTTTKGKAETSHPAGEDEEAEEEEPEPESDEVEHEEDDEEEWEDVEDDEGEEEEGDEGEEEEEEGEEEGGEEEGEEWEEEDWDVEDEGD